MSKRLAAVVLCIVVSACGSEASRDYRAEAPESLCVGETGQVDVFVRDRGGSVTIESEQTRVALTGAVAPDSVRARTQGAIRSLESSLFRDETGSYQVMCLRKGVDVLTVEVQDEPNTLLAIECLDCGNDDPLSDFLDSVSANMPTFTAAYFDQVKHAATEVAELAETAAPLAEALPCGEETDEALVICSADLDTEPDDSGGVVIVSMTMAEAIPRRGNNSLIYAAVFESDGAPGNDWAPIAPFDWDIFQLTDRWYQAIYDHTAMTWTLVVTQVEPGPPQTQTTVPTGAKVVVDGDQLVFLIPRGELPAAMPTYRTTSFGHDGAFSESLRGADVSGAIPTDLPLPFR